MPWVDPPADPLTFRAPMGQDTGEVRPPSLGDVMSSAWSRDSAVVDTWRRLHEENYPIDPGYNPLDDERVKGTKYETQYLGKFSRSYSAKETKKIIADIERDERDTANIDAGGAAGFAASVMAGMTDPTIFIPGGAIYRGAKGGISALRTMGSTALAGGAQVGIQEAMLQSSHPLRTKEESLINIGTGALLAGLIGGGAARFMSKAEQAALRGAMEENRRILGPSAAGAAASDLRTGELRPLMPNVISRGYTRAREAVAKVPYVGKAAEAVMKLPELLTTKGNPLMRLHTSESQAARRAILDLAESPLETMDNELGITSSKFGIPLESDVKLSVYQAQSELYQASNDLFSDYRFKGRAMLPAARSYLEKRFGKSTDLTFDDFMAEVDTALRNNDQHPIPQVQQLAAKFRRWFDTVKDLAQAQGIDIGDDVLGADSFAPRVYDRLALTRDRPEFVTRYVNWRKQDEAAKASLQDQLKLDWERYQGISDKTSDNANRLYERIQDSLMRWNGKTAADARKLLTVDKARPDANKAVTPQLAETSKAIEKAVEKIIARTGKTEQEIVAEAEQTINQILSTPDGRLPKDEPGTVRGFSSRDDMGDLRGSLNARKLPMPDNDLLPFLVRNPLDYTMRYLRQGMSDLNMIARFGDTEGTNVLKDIADEYDAMIRAAPDAKRRVALQKAKEDDIRDFAAIRDRLKGIYGFSPDAFMQSAGRVATAIKDLNVATLGGGFGLAQFPDFAGVVFRNGFMSALKDGWRPFFGKLTRIGGEGMKAAAKDYRAFGLGAETFQSTRMLDAMDAHDIYHHKTPFERTLRLTGQSVVTLSGMTIATDAQKVIASTVAGNNILRAAKAIGDGSASGRTITAMAAGGIDAPMAQRIWTAFEKDGGNVVDGTYLPNLDDWSDKEAARRFMAAVIRDVEIAVLTPGQEKSLFLSSPIISLFGQFKTFTASATTRILLANLQRRDAAALSGLVTQVALGMMSYAAYTAARGGELHERPQDWIKEGIDRSGVIGWFGDINAMTAKGTGGQADLFRLIGADKPLSRYASRGLVGNLLGPAYGKAGDIADMTYAASNGQWTESDMRKLRQLIPFQNLFYLRQLFDEVERNTNSAFGIEPREANR